MEETDIGAFRLPNPFLPLMTNNNIKRWTNM